MAPVTAAMAIASMGLFHAELPVLSVDQIRQWVRRGYVQRVGTDEFGYALYDLDDIVRHATRARRFGQRKRACHSCDGEPCPT